MKYIRTKDGKIVDRLSDFNCFKSHGTTGRFIVKTLEDDNDLELWLQYKRTSIVKQADTIEELCDEFVCEKEIIHYNYQLKNVHYDIDNECAYCSLEEWMKTHNTIYGAIWTDKGLIYVAKMNDKGELELL